MNKPAFDPSQPFQSLDSGKPAFDPSQPFQSGDQGSSTPQGQPSNATMESIAQPFRAIGDAAQPYIQQAASSPDIQPFNGINPFSKPQGGPVQQVLGSMRQVASLPLRYSSTLGQASQPVANYTAEKLGGAGANPYASAAAGMLAGVAADPRSWTPVSGVSSTGTDELSLKVAQAREARTGVPARQFQALSKDPGAFFKGGNLPQAGANIGIAKATSGIDTGVTNDLSSLTPENIERINPTRTIKMDDINTVIQKVKSGISATPQEAQNALDSVNSIMAQPSVQNNQDVFRQWSAIKTHINDALGQAAPDVRAANQEYARQKLGQAFSSFNAVNKSGTPSKLAMMAQQIPGAVGGAIGGAIGGPGWGAAGYTAGKELSSLYHSPFIAGLQTAAGSMTNKAITPLLQAFEKMGTSPQAQAFVLRYLQQQGNQ